MIIDKTITSPLRLASQATSPLVEALENINHSNSNVSLPLKRGVLFHTLFYSYGLSAINSATSLKFFIIENFS